MIILLLFLYITGMICMGVMSAAEQEGKHMRRVFFNAILWPYVVVRYNIRNW